MGFEQRENTRTYRFDVVVKGQPNRRCLVTANLALFLRNSVALQEGPTLSASRLSSDLAANMDGEHELTDQDLRQHTEARLQAEAVRAEKKAQVADALRPFRDRGVRVSSAQRSRAVP